jgi:hypothetical protein
MEIVGGVNVYGGCAAQQERHIKSFLFLSLSDSIFQRISVLPLSLDYPIQSLFYEVSLDTFIMSPIRVGLISLGTAPNSKAPGTINISIRWSKI